MLNKENIVLGTYPYHKHTLNFTLNSLERLNAKNIEFVTCEPHFFFEDLYEDDPKNLKNALNEKGMKMVILTPPTMEYATNLASTYINTRTRTINYIAKAIEYAKYFGAKVVTISAGDIDGDGNIEDFLPRSIEGLKYLCEVAEALDVKLAIYVASNRMTSLVYSIEIAKRIKEAVNSKALGFVADTVYLDKLGVSIKDFINEFGAENVPVVHFADSTGSTMHLAAGEGNLDLKKALAELDEINYQGYISLNMRGSRDPYSYEEQPERCMSSAIKWLEENM